MPRFRSAASLLAAAVLAAAAGLPGVARAQVYAGAAIGQSRFDLDCGGAPRCDRQGHGYKLFAGYMHTPYLGAEASYYAQGTAHVNAGDLTGNGLGASLVAVAPFDAASVHVKVGAYSSHTRLTGSAADGSERHAAFAWGFGAGYKFGLKTEARVDFERVQVRFRSETNHLDLLTAGLLYRF